MAAFVDDLRAGRTFHPRLRIKGVRRAPGVYELTWNGGGRTTWCYGPEKLRGVRHDVWRRIAGHDILAQP
ncbi:hypothetical protein [Streptomyces sp. NPDC002343]